MGRAPSRTWPGDPTGTDYVLPLRWTRDAPCRLADLTAYLADLVHHVRVTVVDGSPPELYAAHEAAWEPLGVRHLRPAYRCRNGKVAGVLTGMAVATSEVVVVADDDVRCDEHSLHRLLELAREADLVGPQNVLQGRAWHTLWDTARTLVNRCVGADYPGTFAVRRTTFAAMGGYDGDVLFENLELIRTVEAYGGRVLRPLDLYVARTPASTRHFLDQRVRQAYDELASPARLLAGLAVIPATALLARRRPGALAVAGLAVVAVAERGRRRAGGRAVFPATASLLAPAWVLERGTCVWVAVGMRLLRGGIRYGGRQIAVAAHSPRELRRRQWRSVQAAPGE